MDRVIEANLSKASTLKCKSKPKNKKDWSVSFYTPLIESKKEKIS